MFTDEERKIAQTYRELGGKAQTKGQVLNRVEALDTPEAIEFWNSTIEPLIEENKAYGVFTLLAKP